MKTTKTPKKALQQEGEPVSVAGKTAMISRQVKTVGGREYVTFRARYWQDGKRQEITAPDIETARKRAKDALKHHESGAGHVMAFKPAEAANVAAAVSKLQEIGVPLLDAVAQFCEAHKVLAGQGTIAEAVQYFINDRERRALKPANVPDLVKTFLAEKEAEGVSQLYLNDITRRLDKFAETFKCSVTSVKTDEIADWLKTIKATGRNGNNYRNAVCTVLSYARERGYLTREKKTEAELLKRFKETAEEVGIYTPKEIRRVLGAAAGPVRAAIAIGAFAGLRNEEIHRLQWGDINLEAGRIIVSADKAKTAQRRIVPILPNLKAWLEPLKQADGPVGPKVEHLTNFSRNISVACKAAGVEMVGNGLRHSFASYRLASVKSADQVALEMGNSPRKLFQHYRELVTAEAAAAWFNVTLETLEEADDNTPENIVFITKGRAA